MAAGTSKTSIPSLGAEPPNTVTIPFPSPLSATPATTASSSSTSATSTASSASSTSLVNFNFAAKAVGTPFILNWSFTTGSIYGDFKQLQLFKTHNVTQDPSLSHIGFSFGDVGNSDAVSVEDLQGSNCHLPTDCEFLNSGYLDLNITEAAELEDAVSTDQFFMGMKYQNSTGDQSYFYTVLFPLNGTGTASSAAGVASSSSSAATSTPSAASSQSTSSSHSLSTGAKVGIAIAAVGAALLVLIAALLLWRRSKKRQAYAYPGGPVYGSQESNVADRDIHTEKEMNVMSTTSSPHEATDRPSALAASPAVVHDQRTSLMSDSSPATHLAPNNRESYHDVARSPSAATATATHPPPPAPTPPPNHQPYSPSQAHAQPVAAGVSHLHEPGMGPEELARLEEEERRLDEAIEEAERRRG